MSEHQKTIPLLQYIPPRLTEGKEWYISYYAIYPATGKLRRLRIKLNRIKSIKQRRAVAKQLISDITKKQLAGWNPFIEAEAPKAFHKLFEVFDIFMRIHEKESEPHTVRTYKSFMKYLKDYLVRNNYSEQMYVSDFDLRLASDIMIGIKTDESLSARTYNNYLKFFKLLFNWMMQFNYVTVNPFGHIKRMPNRMLKKKRDEISKEQRNKLLRYLESKGNNNYLVMCLLCYYCFLRPKEILLLRVKDIDLTKQVVYISEAIAKNDNDSVRTIPDAMMQYIKKLNLDYPPDYYLFSSLPRFAFMPGKQRAEGRIIARYWSDFIRPAMKWPKEIQFYSLKDSGITDMLDSGVAPNFVQGQADHSSLTITSIYAKKRNARAQLEIKEKARSF